MDSSLLGPYQPLPYSCRAPLHLPVCVAAKIIFDRNTGRSRGFGFVAFSSGEDAQTALAGMDGKVRHTFDQQVRFKFLQRERQKNIPLGRRYITLLTDQ